MSRQELQNEAERGCTGAIASLMNEEFNPQGIKASISLKGDCLNVVIETLTEAPTSPPQTVFVPLIQTWIANLASPVIATARVSGRKPGVPFDDWETTFIVQNVLPSPIAASPLIESDSLASSPTEPTEATEEEISQSLAVVDQPPSSSFWGGVMGQLGNVAGAVGGAVGDVATGAAGLVTGAAGVVSGAAADAASLVAGVQGKLPSSTAASPPIESDSPASSPTEPTEATEEEISQSLAVVDQPPSSSFWGGVMGQLGNVAGAVGGVVSDAATGAAGAVSGVAADAASLVAGVQGKLPSSIAASPPIESDSPVSSPAEPTEATEEEISQSLAVVDQSPSSSFWGGVMGQLGNVAGAVGGAVGGAATGAAGLVTGAAGAVSGAAAGAGGAIVGAGEVIASAAVSAGGALGNTALNLTDQAGSVLDVLSNSSELQRFLGPIAIRIPGISQFLEPIFNVDVVKAETHVRNLQAKYPHESINEIAHRLMLEKSIIAGGSGIVTSLPAIATALFAVDVAANAMLQAELVYQIAYLYGLNLKEPARKAEVAAILGLSIAGSQAASQLTVRLGLTALAKNIPIAGSVIGASTNAAAIYAMGYAACRFYEARLANNSLTLEATLAATETANEDYLASIADDQVAMDWILVWMFLAGHPDKTLADLIPQLDSLNLSPASISELKSGMQTLPSLDDLLPRVNDDFGVALLAKCQSIAIADGVISSEEQAILNRLNTHFAASLQAVSLDLAED